MKKYVVLLVLVVLIVAGVIFARENLTVTLPEYQAPKQVVLLEQNWTPAQWNHFHHIAQGSSLLPYDWFLALEQPCFSPLGCEPFADQKYLGRFGFLADKADPVLNPDALPVGFTKEKNFNDPLLGRRYAAFGFNCAACHTGELHVGDVAVRIEGGPAMVNLAQFEKAIGLAVVFTKYDPFRYRRFERKVLGESATDDQKKELKTFFNSFLDAAQTLIKETTKRKTYDNVEGFGRIDALTRIGNQVFAVNMNNWDNLTPDTAPVRFPQVWDASWLNWVQYNSSIANPLARNIGEAMGVHASAKLFGPQAAELQSSVSVEGAWTLEDLLAGPDPYKGLWSPKWPKAFPALDQAKVARGKALYKQHCEKCHLPPTDELQADLASPNPQYWESMNGKHFLKVTDVKLSEIGTDPHQAMDFKNRSADTGDLKLGRVSAAKGLDYLTRGMANKFFDANNFPPEKRIVWSGYHDPNAPAIRDPAVYMARPLNGIWAVAPYLHNGSVPNLFQLLSPAKDRPETFWLGNKQYDPVNVGYVTSEFKGGTEFNVHATGSSNAGHEYGTQLPVEDRWALIEYLKNL